MPEQSQYQVILYDTSGNRLAIFDTSGTGARSGFRNFQLQRRLNDFDFLTFTISGDDTRKSLFGTDYLVQVMRKIDASGANWYQEYLGFHRSPQEEVTSTDRAIFTSYSRGLNDLLNRRKILYNANTSYTLKQAAGETVMKEFVNENAGPAATSPPRKRDGVFPNFSVEPSAGLGTTWGGARSWQNLLEVLKDISVETNVDFGVMLKSGLHLGGSLEFEFRVFTPMDRSATVYFALQFGNMREPSYTLSRTEEANVVAVLGEGQESNRRVVIRNTAATADSPWNDVEATYDARGLETLSALNQAGDQQLEKLKAETRFAFQPIQTDELQYGRDYFLGDIVNASFGNNTALPKIVGVNINLGEGVEEISMEFSTAQ